MIELIRRVPELMTQVLSSRFGVSVSPGLSASPFSEASRVIQPRTLHADAAFVFSDAHGTTRFAVVFEVQRAWDPEKRWSWPLYVTHLENEARVDAALMVYCPDARVGARYRDRLGDVGVSVRIHPFVVTPDDLPLVLDPHQAEDSPELAVFGMMAHGREQRASDGFPAYAAAVEVLSERLGLDAATSYHDLVKAVMSAAVRDEWSEYMSTSTIPRRWFSEDNQRAHEKGVREGLSRGKSEGVAEGEARSLLTILRTRGFEVPDALRDRVFAADSEQLERWIQAAVTADHLDQIFS
ncbi:MAG: hypothetical protein QM621_07630 [Aeromicrobium sp.]|uniref:hypothetical protein n=1 Tax=Aeromicrobium sp. TaxID=1871063 RepID=UPI0039E34DCC